MTRGGGKPLAKRAGIEPSKIGGPLADKLAAPGGIDVVINGQKVTLHGSFEVTVNGRMIKVIPVK